MPDPFRLAVLALAAILMSLPVSAQEMDARFTLSLRGITGGQVAIRAREEGGTYAITAAAQPTGLVGAFSDYAYTGEAQGVVTNGRHVSTRYSEREEDGDEVTSSVTRFQGTAPRDVTFSPAREPRAYDIDPTAQTGVVDLLTGLYLVLRDTDPARACNQSHDLFDGRHVARLSLGPAQAGAEGAIRCTGEYRRIAGYDPADMARRPATPLTFLYGPAGGGRVRVVEVRSPTRVGEAVLRRQ